MNEIELLEPADKRIVKRFKYNIKKFDKSDFTVEKWFWSLSEEDWQELSKRLFIYFEDSINTEHAEIFIRLVFHEILKKVGLKYDWDADFPPRVYFDLGYHFYDMLVYYYLRHLKILEVKNYVFSLKEEYELEITTFGEDYFDKIGISDEEDWEDVFMKVYRHQKQT